MLDAADFFRNKNHGTKNPLHRNQYGGTINGPIIRDKLFFFGSYEGFRQVAPTVGVTRVPTAAERASVTDPLSKSLLQFSPTPHIPNAPPRSNHFIANVGPTTLDPTGLGKADYNLRPEDQRSSPGA